MRRSIITLAVAFAMASATVAATGCTACSRETSDTADTARVTVRKANPGYLYDAPLQYDSELVHDRKNRQYILLTKNDDFCALVPVMDMDGTPAVTAQE